jgi:hypothetical protein
VWFNVCCLKSDELQVLNIFSANKVAVLRSVALLCCLLNCIIGTVQVTEGRMRPAGHVKVSPVLEYGMRKVQASSEGWKLDSKRKCISLISR